MESEEKKAFVFLQHFKREITSRQQQISTRDDRHFDPSLRGCDSVVDSDPSQSRIDHLIKDAFAFGQSCKATWSHYEHFKQGLSEMQVEAAVYESTILRVTLALEL